jgi:hypothetical protein
VNRAGARGGGWNQRDGSRAAKGARMVMRRPARATGAAAMSCAVDSLAARSVSCSRSDVIDCNRGNFA